MINAAAAHHKPETFLQWIIATADEVASGFEREEFDRYNDSKDETREGQNHFTARLLTLFEQVRINNSAPSGAALGCRYRLKPLAPLTIFPVEAQQYKSRDREHAKNEYAVLWRGFVSDLDKFHEATARIGRSGSIISTAYGSPMRMRYLRRPLST